MDGRGGCCLVRYAGEANVASKMELIMLRYRPIAPKPPSPGRSPASATPVTEPGKSMGGVKVGGAMARRRGRREGMGRRGRKRRAPYPEEGVAKKMVIAPLPMGDLVTLPLMPETPVAVAAASSRPPDLALSYSPAWGLYAGEGPGTLEVPAGSSVTLECLTETCEVAGDGKCSLAEARAALEGDACPAFLSDASDRVAWTNAAYRRMVGSGEAGEMVALATGRRLPSGDTCGGFSCRVSVRCARRRGEKASWSLVAPCDVWQLAEGGWLAWRLDVKAALSLGR